MRRSTRLRLRVGAALVCCSPTLAAQLPAPRPQAQPGVPTSNAALTANVAGTVVSADGALISGATVTLSLGGRDQKASSDEDGAFQFPGMEAGTYTLSAALPGFTTQTQQLTVRPGQRLQLPPVVLSLATVTLTLDAMTPEQIGTEQVHAEEAQRLLGVLPNFFVSYTWNAPPLTAKQKFTLATHNVLDPGNLALVGVTAGIQQAANAYPGYDQGAAGYGRRFGADLGNLVIGSYLGGAVLPALLRQDPRYFYKGTGTRWQRFVYAASRAVITRGDNGHEQPNVSGVLGDFSAAALSNAYYPASDRQGASLFLTNGVLAVAGDALNGVVQEFVFHRITTKRKTSAPPPDVPPLSDAAGTSRRP